MKPSSKFKSLKLNYTNYDMQSYFSKKIAKDNLNLQVVSRQKTLLRYFSSIRPTKDNNFYQDLLKLIECSPTYMIPTFSSHIFNRLSIWIQKFISMPKESASIISQFYENDSKLQYFAFVTFPALYHHFSTDEFCRCASQLVIYMILNEPRYIGNAFALSYLQSSSFFESLWYNFDKSNPKEEIYKRFIESIQLSNVCLTKYQIQIFSYLIEKSRTNYGS